ncbi:pentatricopeptide repeat-containing protein At3g61520, mitochondrial [Pyrus x bretschneideri]|uniref:pentatricopeptide repeat-containing protein At3g61520, mitochondrial n=1 Tax=Pyrus x bretschneideri TaxID=225117 RepID=UPI002030A19A|nr:pentatricopeptide repeat-containing protein At3g61520, mitochondrial [Pyrus x bretschneideri]
MNHPSLSASKHLLNPQSSKTRSYFVPLLLNHHFSTDSDPNPKPKPSKQPRENDSLVTQVVQLLQSNEKDWNLDQLGHLLFSDTTTAPSPRSLFHITRRLETSSKALKFFDYVSENVATSPDSAAAATASLSSSFQAVLELTKREPNSRTRLFDMYKMAKERNIPVNMGAAVLLVRSLGFAGMVDEAVNVFNGLDPALKNTHLRNVVIDVLLKWGRVDDALKVLDKMFDPNAEFRVNSVTGDIVLSSLLKRAQRGRRVSDEDIVGLVQKFGEHGVFPDSLKLTKLITSLCRNRNTSRAWDVLQYVINSGGAVETACCNALLTGLGRVNDFKRMNELMVKMKEMDILPDVVTFGIVINFLCKSRRVDEALELFERMSRGGEKTDGISAEPDEIMYNTLIDGLCKVGRQEEGLRLMEKMRLQKGCAPNTVTYNSLIDGFNKVGDIKRGRELYDQMKEEGIPPSVVTLNTLVDGLCRHGRLNSAIEFLNEMQRDGLKGNVATYTTLISSFCNVNNIGMAMELFEQMLSSGCSTDAKVYYCMISGLSQAGRMDDASFVVSKLKEAGFSLDVVAFNVLINGFCKTKKLEKVHEMIEEMETAGVKPDSITYNTLISYLCSAGELTIAHRVLSKMINEDLVPTVVTFGSLIHAYCLKGDINKAMKIFRDMGSKSSAPPNTVVYNILIDSLCKNNQVEFALSLMDSMKDKGVRPNTLTFNAMFKGLRENNLLQKAFKLMDQMVEQACNPDYITMEILTEWLSAVGETEKLRRFVQGYEIAAASTA